MNAGTSRTNDQGLRLDKLMPELILSKCFLQPPYFIAQRNEIALKHVGAGSGIRARDFEIPQEARVNRFTL
jgi:hypothetical protein